MRHSGGAHTSRATYAFRGAFKNDGLQPRVAERILGGDADHTGTDDEDVGFF